MTTTALNTAYVPHDPSSLSQPESREPERTCVVPMPPDLHAASVEEGLRSPVVNLKVEDGGATGKSQEHGRNVPSSGGHGVDNSQPLSFLRELIEWSPNAGVKGPAWLDVAVDLPKPAHHSVPKGDGGLPPSTGIGGQGAATIVPQRPGHLKAPPRDRADPFSLVGLSTLQTFIPHDLFPDDLLVHDPDNITKLRRHKSPSTSDKPFRYVRVFPNLKAPYDPFLPFNLRFSTDLKAPHTDHLMPPQPAFSNRSPKERVRVAHLYLKAGNKLGSGHHSSVFSAPLRMRLNPASAEETIVRIAAKTASGTCGAHKMLHMEASVYDSFPRQFMDDQYYAAGTAAAPTAAQLPFDSKIDPTAALAGRLPTNEGNQGAVTARRIEPAVVPKCYGYYVAVTSDGTAIMPTHSNCGLDATCSVSWPTHILLVEECGRPIFPQVFTQEQKLHCLQLVRRLHAAGFAQNSMFARNVLVQPGPLSAPLSARSYTTPSFRIIDFGRGVVFSHLPPGNERLFLNVCEAEEWCAVHKVLELCKAGTKGSPCRLEVEPVIHLDEQLCTLYKNVMSLHWSGQERRRRALR
ncbi:hypothetical protein GSI_08868 [Ganoderma sinense ZZ0214-1]|uniref:Protein kinase domain-containing protein n=1 Tax=Ganoderma sinense ZZ0214-1 TaxID=1077348 RepID=A0A2G8S4W8_9APHY|nr:hypothetical protein GSI_08868 [Ganoderma sinense ZZ0214-1]